jgi:flagellar biosynthesis GTPase FlhF
MAKRSADIDTEVDALFQLPLGEFTAARNALAARLKKAGRSDEADRVKGIQKPPASAWAVNQLYWRHPKDVDALLGVGERFRKAQAAQLAGKNADVRDLLNQRRDALSTLMTRASAILREAGHAVSPDSTRRIATTLESLTAWGRTDGAPQAGRLTDDLDPPGFEALAALVPRPGAGKNTSEPSRLLQFRKERARAAKGRKTAEDQAALLAEARDAVDAAEKALRDAQRDAERAEAMLKQAAARAKAAEKEKEEVEKRYEKLQEEAQAASKEARRVAEQAEEAAQAVTDAERELEKARTTLARYD